MAYFMDLNNFGRALRKDYEMYELLQRVKIWTEPNENSSEQSYANKLQKIKMFPFHGLSSPNCIGFNFVIIIDHTGHKNIPPFLHKYMYIIRSYTSKIPL